MKQHNYVVDAPISLKDVLREIRFAVNLFMAFIGLIVFELYTCDPPTMERVQQDPGSFILLGLVSVWGLGWIFMLPVSLTYHLVRGPRQKQVKETV